MSHGERDRCLILGGAGFIGVNLGLDMARNGDPIRIFDHSIAPHIKQKFGGFPDGLIEFVEGDFLNETVLEAALQGCKSCAHLVTTTLPASSNENKVFDIETNLLGTVRLLEVARRLDVKKIVYLSSGGTVYGNPLYTPIDEEHPTNPLSSYGINKLAIEKYFQLFNRLYGFNSVILRLSNPFGPGQRGDGVQGAIAVFVERAFNAQEIEIWGDGKVVRDYIFIDDAVSAIRSALVYDGPETVFNIGFGEGHDLNELIGLISKVLGKAIEVSYKPSRSLDVKASILKIDRAIEHLQWRPKVSLEDGIGRFIEWRQTRI